MQSSWPLDLIEEDNKPKNVFLFSFGLISSIKICRLVIFIIINV